MKAIAQLVFGGPEVLQAFVEVPDPEPGPRDLLVRVHAAAVNPVDVKQRRGGPAGAPVPSPPRILGWDASGVVTAVGPEVQRFHVGDEVYFAGSIARPGAYAELTLVDERIAAPKPRRLSHLDAAAIPLTALTAWEALVENMGCSPTDHSPEVARTLLVVGGAGGVGSITIQIARQVCGLRVIATASRPESAAWCARLGADAVIDHTKPLLAQLQALGDDGVDLVLNTAPPEHNLAQVLEVVRPFGHVCGIVSPGAPLDLGPLFRRRGHLSFEYMFTRPLFGAGLERQGAILARVADLLDQGVLLGTRTTTMPWDQVQAAHRLLETGRSVGKTVLAVLP